MKTQVSRYSRFILGASILILAVAVLLIYFSIKVRRPVIVRDVKVVLDPAKDIGEGVMLYQIDFPFEGQVYEVQPPDRSYSIPVKIRVDNPGEVRQGMLVHLEYDPGWTVVYAPQARSMSSFTTAMTIEPGFDGEIEIPVKFSHPTHGAYVQVDVAVVELHRSYPSKNPHQFSKRVELMIAPAE